MPPNATFAARSPNSANATSGYVFAPSVPLAGDARSRSTVDKGCPQVRPVRPFRLELTGHLVQREGGVIDGRTIRHEGVEPATRGRRCDLVVDGPQGADLYRAINRRWPGDLRVFPVGARNAAGLRDLRVFVDHSAESVTSDDLDIARSGVVQWS
jgi:hypothetical protein